MVDIIVDQPVLPFSHGIAIRHALAEAPVRVMRTCQDCAVSKSSANDNQLVWPLIPFPEDWCGT
jgi:hypothetical protein